ncbi:MAG: endolytic transglycosylase MltG [Anaerolineae bacterium]|nr:endolytic transglycosylase MltG [Anaerolineae bacterium]
MPPENRPFLKRVLPSALLLVGTLAWAFALGMILTALLDADSTAPEQPRQVTEQPTLSTGRSTLAAVSQTPVPTATQSPTAVPPTATPAPPTPPPTNTPRTDTDSSAAGENTTAQAADDVAPQDDQAAANPDGESPVENDTAAAECPPPDGWERHVVQPDDTWFAFFLGSGGAVASVDELMQANCVTSRWLNIGQVIFLPPGAADNAPLSAPAVPASGALDSGEPAAGSTGPRPANCPCTISVSPGWRREQIAEAIDAAQTAFTGADFLAATGANASAPFDFVMERPPGTSMEGFMFPGTYTAQNNTTAEGFRDMLLEAFANAISPQVRADAAAQGVTFYQALIIASIVQREVHGPEAQKIVASVYYNRYRDGNRLASTIPVQYALGQPGNWWPRITNTNAEADTPYNTYTRPGLPPTPVDNPGLSAIIAAVYPAQTNYYYHTAACDGSGEVFAETYEEHLANANCD